MSLREIPPRWVSTVARIAVGAVFAYSGFTKILDVDGTIRAVRAYKLLPESVAPAFGSALPLVELIVAVLLLAGLITRVAAAVSGVLFVMFLFGVGQAWARGLSIECGCFGGGGFTPNPVPGYVRELVLDTVMLAFCGWLVLRPASRFSLDGVLGLTPPADVPEPDDDSENPSAGTRVPARNRRGAMQ